MQMNHPLLVARDGTALQWHEAVALVHEVANAVAEGRLASVPPVGRLALEPDGTLFCGSGGISSRVASRDVHAAEIVGGLKRLLGDLLDPTAPAELRTLAGAAPQGQAPPGLEQFTQALAFFERPSRQHDLEALAGRLREAEEQSQLEAELERLTRKARVDETGPPEPTSPADKSIPFWRTRIVLVAIALLVLTVAGAGLMVLSPAARSSGGALLSKDLPKGIIAKVRAAAASTFRVPASQPAAPAAISDGAPGGEHGRARRPVGAADRTATRPSQGRGSVEIVRATEPDVIEVFISREPTGSPAAGVPRDTPTIYDRRNHDVIPATLLRPRLPTVTRSALSAGRSGLLEVVVAEDGHVEQVRLVSTTIERRYYDAMILAAVKAWVFEPASRAGQPVRYRLQVPLP